MFLWIISWQPEQLYCQKFFPRQDDTFWIDNKALKMAKQMCEGLFVGWGVVAIVEEIFLQGPDPLSVPQMSLDSSRT